MKKNILFLGSVPIAAVLIFGGCAGVPRPDTELARSDSAVKEAIELGARVHAPLVLREAETKLNQAKLAADNKENKKARMLAEEAVADAELAQVTTLATKAQRSVDELNQSIDLLRKELGVTNKTESQ
jgi:ribosome assembly protein YihI (activator of Der GTPase)